MKTFIGMIFPQINPAQQLLTNREILVGFVSPTDTKMKIAINFNLSMGMYSHSI